MSIDKGRLKKSFNDFLSNFEMEKYHTIWMNQSETFKNFWNSEIMKNNQAQISENEYDPIIRLLDVKARGFNSRTDEAVAHVGLRQGVWYRIFKDLREKTELRRILSDIFNSENDDDLVKKIDQLKKENEKNKNGLTGNSAVALNALLYINKPDFYISSVSLRHRYIMMKSFDFGNLDVYKTYGEKIIKSNRDIIKGFRDKYEIDTPTLAVSKFLYSQSGKVIWQNEPGIDSTEPFEEEPALDSSEFAIEKNLEDFLVANWESTELGKKYDLIEDDGEIVSQQYRTNEVGNIDLLVKEKNTNTFVVIELKKGQTSDVTVGQIARYMGWIKKHKTGGKKVKGIIIARDCDAQLKYAHEMIADVELFRYKINFTLEKM